MSETHRLQGYPQSISDDDLCASCTWCNYNPGSLSTCELYKQSESMWLAEFDKNNYALSCEKYIPFTQPRPSRWRW